MLRRKSEPLQDMHSSQLGRKSIDFDSTQSFVKKESYESLRNSCALPLSLLALKRDQTQTVHLASWAGSPSRPGPPRVSAFDPVQPRLAGVSLYPIHSEQSSDAARHVVPCLSSRLT